MKYGISWCQAVGVHVLQETTEGREAVLVIPEMGKLGLRNLIFVVLETMV